MQSLSTALRRLESLRDLVEEYGPIKFQSTERSRELSRLISEAYGAVEEVYQPFQARVMWNVRQRLIAQRRRGIGAESEA